MTAEPTHHDEAQQAAISVRGLSHTYKARKPRRSSRGHGGPSTTDAALDHVDLEVRPGEVFALLGPNGSGKSTLLRILATVQAARPTANESATVQIFGRDVAREPAEVRSGLGVVFQNPSLDLKLTALENLCTHGKLYGLSGEPLHQSARAALSALGLADRMNEHAESFSGGMRRRVEIAKALLTRPRLLLMDEASAGLDLAIQRDIWADLRKLVEDRGLTVLLTTHLMHEAELCDRVAVMSRGKIVAVDTPRGLVGRVGGQVLEITPAPGTTAEQLIGDIRSRLNGKLDPTAVIEAQAGHVRIEHPAAAEWVQPLSQSLGEAAEGFRLGRPTLADAYLKLTGQTLDQPHAL